MEIQSGKFTRIAGKRHVSYKYCSSLLIAVDYLKTFCDKVDLALFQVVTPKVLPKKVRCTCAFAKIKEKHKIKTVTIFFIGFMYLFCKVIKCIYPKENLSYGMPVYRFSHHLLAVLVHLAHTAVKWKTNVDDFVK